MYVVIRSYMVYTTTDRIPTDTGYVMEYTDGGSWPCFGFSYYFTPTLITSTSTTVVSLLKYANGRSANILLLQFNLITNDNNTIH
jgi:hypothetical protein